MATRGLNRWWSALVLLLTVAGCAAINEPVRWNYDKNADFARYRTFAVEPIQTEASYGLLNERVARALEQALSRRGLRATTETPDLRVRFVADVEQVTDVDIDYIPTEQGVFTRYLTDSETRRRLLVNMVDSGTGRVVWKGETSTEADRSRMPSQEDVDRAIALLLSYFPTPAAD